MKLLKYQHPANIIYCDYTVHVVTRDRWGEPYCGPAVGLFSTREEAEKHAEELRKLRPKYVYSVNSFVAEDF
ncbi:MAG: hypothetical protein NC548_22835 [Lachnospiraceae bacterium]|nr:hypothetical protein [Lachnospiraceae bacterium]